MDTTKQAAQPRIQITLRTMSLILIAIGIFASGYLSYTELSGTEIQCIEGAGFNCDIVQNSVYSKLAGIPIAYLGVGAYLFLGALLLLENRIALLREYGATLVAGITFFAFLYSAWLVYVQAVLLEAFCPWCLTHEVVMTALFIISGLRWWRTMQE